MTSAVSRRGLCKKQGCFLCCLAIAAWLHGWSTSRRVQVCPEKKRKTWWCQSYRWFKRSVRDHTRVQMSNGSYCGLRDSFAWRETMIYNLRYCLLKLFVYGWLIPMLISWVLWRAPNIQQICYKKKTTTIIGATWRLFFVCSSCLFTFSLSRALAYLAMHNSVTGSIIYPFRRRSLKTCCM